MDYNINYYSILEVTNLSTLKELKQNYYKLSKKLHPDVSNNENDIDKFKLIAESYSILSDAESRSDYDKRSKWGKNYSEKSELLNFEFDSLSKSWDEVKFNDFKKNETLNIVCYIDDAFDGNIEYERWVICKMCKGSGKDLKSKIEIRDDKGNIRFFEAEDGCDYCEGSGVDGWGNICSFCVGQGKIGMKICVGCDGKKKILGKQRLSNIFFPEGEKDVRVDFMGNSSPDIPGKVGHLWLVKK